MTREQLQAISKDPKAFLSRSFRTNERIAAKQERIASWRQRAKSITAELKADAGTGGSSPSKLLEMAVCNIVDLEREIKEEIQELIEIQREIGVAIEELILDSTYKVLLELRYLNHLKWEEIAVRLGFTFRWTMTMHKRALKEFSIKAL